MKASNSNSVTNSLRSPKHASGNASPDNGPAGGLLYGLVGICILLVIWQLLSITLNPVIIASPLHTVSTFLRLLTEKRTWVYVATTLQRLLIGLLIGSAIGTSLGLAAGLNRCVRQILEPVRWVAMTVPAVVIAIVAMLWFGMGSKPVTFIAAIINVPLTYVNVMEGMMAIDDKLVEMARSFRLPRRMLFTEVYLPSIGSALMAALTLTVGMGVRVVVLAELMGAHDGIGYAFSRAWIQLDTPAIFAWMLMSLLLLGALEFGILAPIKKRLLRWKTVK